MATPKSQRIFIWIIAIVMAVGTLGAYFALILGNDSSSSDQLAQQQAAEAEQQKQIDEYRKSLRPLDGYKAEPFDKASVTTLKVETLKEGTGTAASANSKVKANYFGWTSDGKIFDSTNKNGAVAPIEFGLDGVIKGWTEGLTGVKAGSIVKLTIPSDKAYGDTAVQPGAPTGPLTFVVELVEVQ